MADRYASAGGMGGQPLPHSAVAHLAALRARESLGARRVWLLLPKTASRTYGDCIYMPRWAPAVVAESLLLPDQVSMISEMLSRRHHLKSWAGLADGGDGAWSMLTTSLEEVRSPRAVPVWSGDAVVLAGSWPLPEAACAVELAALAALADGPPPVMVVPLVTDPSGGPGSAARQITLARTVAATLATVAGPRRSVTVTADTTFVSRADSNVLDEVRAVGARAHEVAADVPAVSDTQWAVLRQVLPREPCPPRRGPRPDLRRHVVGALWQLRTRGFWCDLPPELGDWQMVYRQWQTWESDGTLDALLHLLTPFPEPKRPSAHKQPGTPRQHRRHPDRPSAQSAAGPR
ncbi:transposase [Streptomyces sp. NPDC056244]|uniref:transposase n=1 Tax=Streptomyces sp. NPDC056244 TaxID=3345762 RepID=UPI0035DB9ED3